MPGSMWQSLLEVGRSTVCHALAWWMRYNCGVLVQTLFILMLVFVGPAFGQQAKPPIAQVTKPLPISHYMQESGLLYLNDVGKMIDKAMDDHLRLARREELPGDNPYGMPDENVYGKALTDLENHIEINITLDGDKQFLKLLEQAKNYSITSFHEILRTSDPKFKSLTPHPAVAKMYPTCDGQAHGVIRAGEFTRGDCSEVRFEEADKADEQLKTKKNEDKPQ
jgi:hypothetical protein